MTISPIVAMCGPHYPVLPYNLLRVALGSGFLGLIGWAALFAVPLGSAIVVSLRASRPSKHPTRFYGFAHVCFLIFLLNSVVLSSLRDHPSSTMLNLSIGLIVMLVSCGAVTIFIRQKPVPDLWSCVGLCCVAATIALHAAGMLITMHAPRQGLPTSVSTTTNQPALHAD